MESQTHESGMPEELSTTDSGSAREPHGKTLRDAVTEESASLALALQFLTSVPPLLRREATAAEVGRSMAYFPLVGLGLGLSLAGLDALFALGVAMPVRSALLLVALILLTGGLHLDGLMDTCDGLFGGRDPSRRLEIMRDSRVGSFGVLGAATSLILRFAALSALPDDVRLPAFVAAAVLGRWAVVLATRAFPYARPKGLGAAFKQHLSTGRMLFASVVTLGVAIVLLEARGLVLFATAVIAAWLFGRFVVSRVPGHTGDTYGATNELVELLVLVLLTLPGATP